MSVEENFQSGITPDGSYDFTILTNDEINCITEKLQEAEEKFPKEHQAIGLMFLSSIVVYKAGYILPQIVISKYSNSENVLDQLAVALAYSRKGAEFRSRALEHFEKFNLNAIHNMPQSNGYPLYTNNTITLIFADLYEKEYQFDKALDMLNKIVTEDDLRTREKIGNLLVKIDINRAVDYFKKLTDYCPDEFSIADAYKKALEKQQKGYVFKPRKSKPKPEDETINAQIEELAKQFI